MRQVNLLLILAIGFILVFLTIPNVKKPAIAEPTQTPPVTPSVTATPTILLTPTNCPTYTPTPTEIPLPDRNVWVSDCDEEDLWWIAHFEGDYDRVVLVTMDYADELITFYIGLRGSDWHLIKYSFG